MRGGQSGPSSRRPVALAFLRAWRGDREHQKARTFLTVSSHRVEVVGANSVFVSSRLWSNWYSVPWTLSAIEAVRREGKRGPLFRCVQCTDGAGH